MNLEILLKFVLIRLRSVDVIRHPLVGWSPHLMKAWLTVNTCNNMQVAGAATCRLQDIYLTRLDHSLTQDVDVDLAVKPKSKKRKKKK